MTAKLIKKAQTSFEMDIWEYEKDDIKVRSGWVCCVDRGNTFSAKPNISYHRMTDWISQKDRRPVGHFVTEKLADDEVVSKTNKASKVNLWSI